LTTTTTININQLVTHLTQSAITQVMPWVIGLGLLGIIIAIGTRFADESVNNFFRRRRH
jgi:hypothetical protein